jgi:putative methyltransferase (TIGR04325 family)
MSQYGWFGDYKSWTEALADTKSYSDDEIFNRTKQSINKVIQGTKKYERDTILFDRIEFEYHQASLSGLLKVALTIGRETLNILDFGGSLGTLYFAMKSFLNPINLNWNIVEQEHYVKYGKDNIKCINFYYNLEDCLQEQKIDVVIFSSVLQYLENPYDLLEFVVSQNIKHIILDRTAILPDSERLTIQKVPPSIYDSSYPAWFLNEIRIISIFNNKGYQMLADFTELWSSNIIKSKFKGYIFVKTN